MSRSRRYGLLLGGVALVIGATLWLQAAAPVAPRVEVRRAETTPGATEEGSLDATKGVDPHAGTASPRPAEPQPAAGPARPAAPILRHPQVLEARFDDRRGRFVERRYEPRYRLAHFDQPPPQESLTTAEKALASYTSAMAACDLDWWLSLWDAAGRNTILEEARRSNTSIEKYREMWLESYPGARFVLLRRIDLPGYAIIYFRRERMSDSDPEAQVPLALKRAEDGTWRLTHDLRDHPAYMYDFFPPGTQYAREVREIHD